MYIQDQLAEIRAGIAAAERRAGRPAGSVQLLAVSKTFPVEDIMQAYRDGQRAFGENRLQEAMAKMPEMPADCAWHLIGPLQRNKVRQLMAWPPALIHSVDSIALADQIEHVMSELYPDSRQAILTELRIGDEDGEKTGISLEDFPQLAKHLDDCPHLAWCGLMLIPPVTEDAEGARPYFRQVKELFDRINKERKEKLSILSYGMSQDFEVAIEEGATHIRVGTAIFGARA